MVVAWQGHMVLQVGSRSTENNGVRSQHSLLVIADALYGLNQGGPSGYPNLQPNSIFCSLDPVAIDSVMADYIESTSHNTNYIGNGRITLQAAAQTGLGNFETSCNNGDCSFVYTAIDLIKCSQGCGSDPPPMPPTNLRMR